MDKSRAIHVKDTDLIGVEIKQEEEIKLEPEDDVPMTTSFGHDFGPTNTNIVDAAIMEDLQSTQVKFEFKAKADVDEQQSKGSKQSDENDTTKETATKKQQTKKGNSAASKSPVGNLKKRGIGLKGRAKAVFNAAQRKQSAAKRNKKQYKCPSCDHVASKSYNLKAHMLTHTGEKPFSCQICNKRFTQKSNLQRHLKTHSGQKYAFKCSVCLKRFARNDERSEHEAACNGRRFECHLCKKISTPNTSKLKVHMRIHTGDKPFRCGICSKKFTQKSSLKKHSKIHTNPRPLKFQCSICTRNFTEEQEKDQHESKCQRRRYECYLCKSYMTNHKPNMMVHMQTHHTGAKPFRCKACKKCFVRKYELMYHLKHVHK